MTIFKIHGDERHTHTALSFFQACRIYFIYAGSPPEEWVGSHFIGPTAGAGMAGMEVAEIWGSQVKWVHEECLGSVPWSHSSHWLFGSEVGRAHLKVSEILGKSSGVWVVPLSHANLLNKRLNEERIRFQHRARLRIFQIFLLSFPFYYKFIFKLFLCPIPLFFSLRHQR